MTEENYVAGSEILKLTLERLNDTHIIEKNIFNAKVLTKVSGGECLEYNEAGLANFNNQAWYAISLGQEAVEEHENPSAASLMILKIFRRSRTKPKIMEKIPKIIREADASNCLLLVARKNGQLSCVSKNMLCVEMTKELKNHLFKNYEPKINKDQISYHKGIAPLLADAIVRILLSQP